LSGGLVTLFLAHTELQLKKYILFSNRGVSLSVSSPEEVVEKVRTNTTGRAVGYGVAGLFFWPFLIPAVVDGVASSQANTNLDRDFSDKNMEQIIINPFATHSGIIFISNNDFQDSFFVRLVDKETKEKLEYNVRGLKGYYTGERQPSEKPVNIDGKFAIYMPMAFTEQGVAMLSGILNSDRTIEVNIQIMRAFVQLRHMVTESAELKRALDEL